MTADSRHGSLHHGHNLVEIGGRTVIGVRDVPVIGVRVERAPQHRVHLEPPQGFAAETTAAAVLYTATATGAPISTTHAITSAIMGVGATKSIKAVRWGVAKNIVGAWIFTFPGAGASAAAMYGVLYLIVGP